jgi:hypothetical protein
MGSQRLTAWAMARPFLSWLLLFGNVLSDYTASLSRK